MKFFSNKARKFTIVFVLSFMTLLFLSGCGDSSDSKVDAKTSLMIPLYMEPENWDTLINQKKENPSLGMIAIVNQTNGDFTVRSAKYEEGIALLTQNNIEPIGYIYSFYGQRSMEAVKKNVDMWSNYRIQGIFIDEVDDAGTFAYYKELSDYIRSKGLKVIMNPGSEIHDEFVSLADIMVVVEKHYDRLPTQTGIAYKGVRAALWYASPSSDEVIDEALTFAKKHGCSYLYITDDIQPNPWDSYPSYFEKFLAQMR